MYRSHQTVLQQLCTKAAEVYPHWLRLQSFQLNLAAVIKASEEVSLHCSFPWLGYAGVEEIICSDSLRQAKGTIKQLTLPLEARHGALSQVSRYQKVEIHLWSLYSSKGWAIASFTFFVHISLIAVNISGICFMKLSWFAKPNTSVAVGHNS